MNESFLIKKHSVHLWKVWLTDFSPVENDLYLLLNAEEINRANRFRFPQHRYRFIISHGILRQILSLYTNISPNNIIYSHGQRGKPYLSNHPMNLQFNMSHSQDMAVYALTIHHEIGIDVEKIEKKFNLGVAKRFFSEEEHRALMLLSFEEQISAFYRLWAGKEALIKAVGEGLYVPLGSFSIDLHEKSQWVTLLHHNQPVEFYLENVALRAGYQTAFATNQRIQEKIGWEWSVEGPVFTGIVA